MPKSGPETRHSHDLTESKSAAAGLLRVAADGREAAGAQRRAAPEGRRPHRLGRAPRGRLLLAGPATAESAYVDCIPNLRFWVCGFNPTLLLSPPLSSDKQITQIALPPTFLSSQPLQLVFSLAPDTASGKAPDLRRSSSGLRVSCRTGVLLEYTEIQVRV